MMMMIWALVPAHDAHAVRRALRQRGFAFTTQKARGGLWHTAHWIFWLIVPAKAAVDAEGIIRDASPPRTVHYHSPHGWHADAWLHPLTVDLQGAVVAAWAVAVPVAERVYGPPDIDGHFHEKGQISHDTGTASV